MFNLKFDVLGYFIMELFLLKFYKLCRVVLKMKANFIPYCAAPGANYPLSLVKPLTKCLHNKYISRINFM